MKKLLQLLFILCISQVANAQYYYLPFISAGQNPGNLNSDLEYPVGNGLPTGWTTILGPTNATPAWSATKRFPLAFLLMG